MLLVFYLLLSAVSMGPKRVLNHPHQGSYENPKICIHCKHFIHSVSDRYGKCAKTPIVETIDPYLVTGVLTKHKDYEFCSIVRKYNPACGPQGKLFEPRYPLSK